MAVSGEPLCHIPNLPAIRAPTILRPNLPPTHDARDAGTYLMMRTIRGCTRPGRRAGQASGASERDSSHTCEGSQEARRQAGDR